MRKAISRKKSDPSLFRTIQLGDTLAHIVSAGLLDIGSPGRAFTLPEPSSLDATRNLFVDQNVLVFECKNRIAIFETGVEDISGGGPNLLTRTLATAGFSANAINAVIPTHPHLDHIGGLMTPAGNHMFPNASIHLHPFDVSFWLSDDRLGTRSERSALVARRQLTPNLGRLVFHTDEDETFPGVIAMHTPGHTVGHTSFVVGTGRSALFVVGDLVHHECQLAFPSMTMLFDTDREQGVDTRIKILRYLADKAIPALFYHLPFPGVGYVERAGEAFRFVPLGE
ncbi:hypothetical protein BCY90_18485 [Agrobacterium deltaense]|uniref:MBL fold metallo-hydrolase n=1 Tax=Agrobacterium TaxID=357 RepID=UPI0007459C78|nr:MULTISPECIES: MBL fold metallo-hydrolase [Agrobacterium]KVK54038.1 hypothetical protein L901_19320 [Agrobacterium sp. D14]RKF40630.1 hypothetical protein BCY90_18485 [Agrobacterium deltaense]